MPEVIVELLKLRKLYELKSISRTTSVLKRKESSAEHSWSCLILADYFLPKIKIKLDRLKVYELLIYHDVVEIEAGDICLSQEDKRKNKKECEKKALLVLKEKIPPELAQKLEQLFTEFEDGNSIEARFARAIDNFDAEIQEIGHPEDFPGWTEEFVRKKKQSYFREFPEMLEAFEVVLKYYTREGYW